MQTEKSLDYLNHKKMTQQRKRMNKSVVGYILLSLIAHSDNDFDPREGDVIKNYLAEIFPLGGNLDEATELISITPNSNYPILFQNCAEDFLLESTEKERLTFVQFAIKLITADEKIDVEEDYYLGKLYQLWQLDPKF